MIKKADVIVDLQAGDTGKGKVAHALCKGGEYTHVIRYNGGGNAGHTIYHNGKKFVTHFIPCGVLYGIKSIIGPGCVVNVDKLTKEINELQDNGINVLGNLFIDKRTHIITDEHVIEDSKDSTIGTTKTGNGPAYRDKYYRKGIRACDVPFLNKMVIDIYEELHGNDIASILFEGAQGFELDIDWGDYPYVTSSHCTVGSAVLNGVPPQKIENIYGVAKAYRTYVGAKNFEGLDSVFTKIREIGNEFGATTGRPRQINWLNLDDMIKAININGVTDLIINKLDVLQDLNINVFKIYWKNELKSFDNSEDFISFVKKIINKNCLSVEKITFSVTPYEI
jgi:adenylosuccinate synthase